MDLVHIWHDDRYWSKHFLSTLTIRSCKHVRCLSGDYVWMGWKQRRVNGMWSCERDSHVWRGSCVNEVVRHTKMCASVIPFMPSWNDQNQLSILIINFQLIICSYNYFIRGIYRLSDRFLHSGKARNNPGLWTSSCTSKYLFKIKPKINK